MVPEKRKAEVRQASARAGIKIRKKINSKVVHAKDLSEMIIFATAEFVGGLVLGKPAKKTKKAS